MRKASKIVGLLLPLAAAIVMLAGCPTDGDESGGGEYTNPKASSAELKTYYIKAVDAAREAPWNDISDLNRLHFHAPAGTAFKIQKVFVSDTMADGVPAGAVVWYDFTKGDTSADYATGSYGGTVETGTVSGGLWTLDNSSGNDEVYPGNLGIALDGKTYIGFVIANVSGSAKFDNIQLEFMGSGDVSKGSKPCSYYFGFPGQ